MMRAISASEAKNRFAALLDTVVAQGDEIIVERQGKPQAAVIPFAGTSGCSGCVRSSAGGRHWRCCGDCAPRSGKKMRT